MPGLGGGMMPQFTLIVGVAGSGSPGRLREPNVVTLETAGPAQS
jgi:hypothetical protein